MRAWLAGIRSESTAPIEGEEASGSSLLSKWNSYAGSSKDAEGGSSAFKLDIESAVRTANNTVSSTFSVVTKGVREMPSNLQSATSALPSGKALMYFGIFLAAGFFFMFMAFVLFLPIIVLVPQKFAICFTLGCCMVISSFVALNGFKAQFWHMVSMERLPFTVGFVGSMVGTLYGAMVLHSYVLSVIFSVIQIVAVVYYVVSYFPGGSTGIKFLSSSLVSSVKKMWS